METLNHVAEVVDGYVWGLPLILLILIGGIYLTIRLHALQIHHLPLALKWMVHNEEEGTGEVSSFAALCTALAATIGTGNIVGVATAIKTGGPGALFWMLIAALFGMATKYSEGFLAIKYRSVDEDGHVLGGPFYYIEHGMGKKWKWLAKCFAVFGACAGLFGIGTITQVNGISSTVETFFDADKSHTVHMGAIGDYTWAVIITAAVCAILAGLVIIGGIKRISSVSQIIVPFMAAAYIIFVLILIFANITHLPHAIAVICEEAFRPKAFGSGAAATLFVAMQAGIARGIFSNEAGLGSAPIAAAAATTKSPVRQGLVSMTGTFVDTIVVCNMTGLSIVITGAYQDTSLEGAAITVRAFQMGLPFPHYVSAFLVMMALIFFAFTSILGWNYYGERCLEYLTNGSRTGIKIYRWLYILNVLIGPFLTVSAVWNIADIFNGLMAIPNMICLFALSGTIARETNAFFRERAYLKQNEDDRQALEELRVEDGALENAKADRSYARTRKKHK